MERDAEFAACWVSNQRALSAYIMAAIGSFHDAEEILQKVAIVAFTKREQFDARRSSFSTWAIGIARLEIQHWRRDRGRDRLVFDDETLERLAAAHQLVAGELAELEEALIGCLDKMQGRARAMLEMRYRRSMRSTDIARQFRTSQSVVDVTLSRARAALARCIRAAVGWDESAL
jgi:RNA polymerase sigma-70 factor (ECF subfamily)